MKTLKLLALLLSITVLFLTSCNKSSPGGSGNGGYALSIRVENGESYQIDSVYAYTLRTNKNDYGRILDKAAYNNGRFILTLPNNLDAIHLRNIMVDFDFEDSFISDTTVNLGGASIQAYKNGKYCGYFTYEMNSDNMNSFAYIMYADKPVKIKGNIPYLEYETESRWNISFRQGWNISRFDTYMENEIWVEENSANNVQGLKWYYTPN
ncbi:hypothetical protein LJB95_03110 [Paludibacteraceae bacterium OttesenSCG-928-F17]|nr:hypothetical protein [Paludibacteraceae bacterium OttesenSCG-928-F17]